MKITHTKSKAAKAVKAAKAAKAAPKKAPKAAPTEQKAAGPRHPKARVVAKHESKAALAKALSSVLAHGDQDSGAIETRLATASNAQLLRLHAVAERVKSKFGSRDKLIDAIGSAAGKSKDKDYLAKLATYSLPQLLDLAPHA